MLTSRSEYNNSEIQEDNADLHLTEIGCNSGFVSACFSCSQRRHQEIEHLKHENSMFITKNSIEYTLLSLV